jgi:small-conductance mechanosensitive channel
MPKPPRGRLALSFAVALGLLAGAAFAQPAAPAEPATVELWNRPIVVLRKTVAERTPAERARWMAERIADLPLGSLREEVRLVPFENEHGAGVELELGATPVVRIYREDLDLESGETLEQAGAVAAERLRDALSARRLQADAGRLVRGALLALGATALFALLLTALVRSRRFLTARLFLASEAQLRRVTRMGVDLRRYALLAVKYGVDALAIGIGILLAYLWLTFVFVQFPYSAPWGDRLGHYLVDLVRLIGTGILDAVPEFFTVLVILLVTRVLTSLVAQLFRAIQSGRIQTPWFEAETAEATRRIVTAVIWVFALTAAFPFIPGSDSAAFRGIGVLAGVMLSLGSAGIVNQAMSGLVVVYSRAFREGDYVRIGEVEGTVVRRGSLSTKIRNVRNEEVTVPNGVVITAPTINYTRLAGGHGAHVSATVTIGYDAPWRQVHALLELAASRTEGLRATPPPYVVQRALSDWYVEYQLVVQAERSEDRPLAQSRLHAAIQDAFNEHGVQIMSPHFALQPSGKVVVPREQWSAPPAATESDSVREPRRAG